MFSFICRDYTSSKGDNVVWNIVSILRNVLHVVIKLLRSKYEQKAAANCSP